MERFRHEFRTGCGSNLVVLTLDGPTAELQIRTDWMGVGQKRFAVSCAHRVFTGGFGVLLVETIEAATGSDPLARVAVNAEECPLPLVIEYFRVPASPVFVHPESQAATTGPLGYAEWNETFQVVLLVHNAEGLPTSAPLAELCGTIDKLKLRALDAPSEPWMDLEGTR